MGFVATLLYRDIIRTHISSGDQENSHISDVFKKHSQLPLYQLQDYYSPDPEKQNKTKNMQQILSFFKIQVILMFIK